MYIVSGIMEDESDSYDSEEEEEYDEGYAELDWEDAAGGKI